MSPVRTGNVVARCAVMLRKRSNVHFARLLLLLGAPLLPGATFFTQLSSASKAEGLLWQSLARVTIEKLPPAPVFIAVTRVTYDARAAQPLGSRPGPVLE